MSKITLDFESSYDFDIADIASEISKLNSSYQGVFLKMFVSFLHHYCNNDYDKASIQTRHIAKEIDQKTFQFINELANEYREIVNRGSDEWYEKISRFPQSRGKY